VEHARQRGASERHACHLVHQPRGTQRYQSTQRNDEDALTRAIITLASKNGRYGYRRITVKLCQAGWNVGKDRVERIWRREGLKVPQKQKPRGRLWLNDGSCVRLRPERQNHVWSYDFVSTFTHDGRTVRMLNLIDEHTRECLAIHVRRRINSADLIEVLADAMIEHGIPEYIRSDNGPEFVAQELRKWLARIGSATLYIALTVIPHSQLIRKLTSCIAASVVIEGSALAGNVELRHRTPQFRPSGRIPLKCDLPLLRGQPLQSERPR
jgi:putative transposase